MTHKKSVVLRVDGSLGPCEISITGTGWGQGGSHYRREDSFVSRCSRCAGALTLKSAESSFLLSGLSFSFSSSFFWWFSSSSWLEALPIVDQLGNNDSEIDSSSAPLRIPMCSVMQFIIKISHGVVLWRGKHGVQERDGGQHRRGHPADHARGPPASRGNRGEKGAQTQNSSTPAATLPVDNALQPAVLPHKRFIQTC